MSKRFYVDTCIWRDLLEERKSGFSPLGEYAFQFLKNCRKNAYQIFVSTLVVNELKTDFSDEQIQDLFEPFMDVLVFIEPTKEDTIEVRSVVQRSGIHWADAGHTVLATKNNCVLITRDKHYDLLSGMLIVQRPEEVVFPQQD